MVLACMVLAAAGMQDHHFHWGYILNCAAVLAKADPAWGQQYKPPLLDLIRDIGNPIKDSHFPLHRYLDMWAGHSWASGIGPGPKNQESSSEAVNAYYGMALLGDALGDEQLRDLGRVFLQVEIEGAKWYWHMSSARPQVYPTPSTFADTKCVGRRFADGADRGTFFGTAPQEVDLIQMLPFSPVSEVLLSPDWVAQQWPVLARTRSDGWNDLVAANQAIVEPAQAWAAALDCSAHNCFGSGTTLADTLYWIASRPANTGTPLQLPRRLTRGHD